MAQIAAKTRVKAVWTVPTVLSKKVASKRQMAMAPQSKGDGILVADKDVSQANCRGTGIRRPGGGLLKKGKARLQPIWESGE